MSLVRVNGHFSGFFARGVCHRSCYEFELGRLRLCSWLHMSGWTAACVLLYLCSAAVHIHGLHAFVWHRKQGEGGALTVGVLLLWQHLWWRISSPGKGDNGDEGKEFWGPEGEQRFCCIFRSICTLALGRSLYELNSEQDLRLNLQYEGDCSGVIGTRLPLPLQPSSPSTPPCTAPQLPPVPAQANVSSKRYSPR
ncbi:hypothetical protein EJ06DRAFT_87064 [Trichodelitschia bisporula]|uniref:Uncharacterized protein n=1 Tax=Trichodelitschia bisporula TaxID=703511 RepID=A0A6G1HS44_9PEZI|nr:hypothetical protein EJ06DRAFT_87064 [Trichodelitschia bisporula]